MRKLFTQILAVFFLLIIVGNKLVKLSHDAKANYSVEKIFSAHKFSSKKIDYNASSFQVFDNSDNSDESDSDFLESLDFMAISAKVLTFAFLLSFIYTKYVKHRFCYDAFIRLFDKKYIVLQTLRI